MLSRRQRARVLSRYGKALVAAAPDDTTALLMDLCLPPPGGAAGAGADESFVASVADFAHLYADRPTRLLYLCEFILFNAAEAPPGEQSLYHMLLELYLTPRLADEEAEAAGAEPAADAEPQVRCAPRRLSRLPASRPRPRP